MSLITNLKPMYSIKRWYDIWDIVKTPIIDIMVIGKKFIPDKSIYWYLIPSPTMDHNLWLIWVTKEELDNFNIEK